MSPDLGQDGIRR